MEQLYQAAQDLLTAYDRNVEDVKLEMVRLREAVAHYKDPNTDPIEAPPAPSGGLPPAAPPDHPDPEGE